MNQSGRLHPISIAIREIAEIFGRMGFGIAYGPELEDEFHNFDALNVPADHPARDMQDTFWIKDQPGKVLRTHTSPVQIRYMEEQMKKGIEPPYRIIVPGKVFRNEATDATHEAQFYQLEGLAIGTDVTLAELKGTIERFYREYFGEKSRARFRPSFFPFTEPSVEIDAWFEPSGKAGKWLEMSGGGMVHPSVLEHAGVNSKKYQGFAFGGGIERLLMVKHGVPDVRLFHSGDIRFNYTFEKKLV
jgi:phenylalanyl-tRNA synthetase alpha chain